MLRERENMNIRLMVQVDTLCHKIPELHREGSPRRHQPRAGRPRKHQLREPARGQEAPEQDHRNTARCCSPGRTPGPITTPATFLGFPFDTPESIREDMAIISGSCRSISSNSSA
jgi:hypothetical protein